LGIMSGTNLKFLLRSLDCFVIATFFEVVNFGGTVAI